MAISQRGLTLDQFLELPDQKPALEYWGGAVSQKVSPKSDHGRLQPTIARLLDQAAEPGRLGWAFTETRATFAGRSVVPDVTFYLRDRIPRESDGHMAQDFHVPPDVAIEIISPGQTVRELHDRCRWYVDHGVKIALFVNPRDLSVTRVRPGGDEIVLRAADRIDLAPVLPAFQITVQELFDSLKLD